MYMPFLGIKQSLFRISLKKGKYTVNKYFKVKYMNKKATDKLTQALSLITCFLMILAVSLHRDGKWLGHEIKNEVNTEQVKETNPQTVMADGTIVINTKSLAKDIIGYAGPVPVNITIKDGNVLSITPLDNSETPEFFNRASTIIHSWNGKTLEEAANLQVDGISGATLSSKAIIGNVKRGIDYAMDNRAKESIWSKFNTEPKAIAGLVVALMAAILPLYIKNKRYKIAQQILNVLVLGFWCGHFLSYSSIIGYMSNSMNVISLIVPVILLITAFIYPLFGKKQYYCTNICPLGSLQELTGRCVKHKIKISSKTIKRLDTFRQALWAVLMLCLWTGIWADWVDYEPFSAFIFQSASWVVITIAIIAAALSTIIMRPYCRFVCPTGTLFKISESNK